MPGQQPLPSAADLLAVVLLVAAATAATSASVRAPLQLLKCCAVPPARALLPKTPRRRPLSRFRNWFRRGQHRYHCNLVSDTGRTLPPSKAVRIAPPSSKPLIRWTDIGLTAATFTSAASVSQKLAKCLQAGKAIVALLALPPPLRSAHAAHGIAQHAARYAAGRLSLQRKQLAVKMAGGWLVKELVAHHFCDWLLTDEV